MLKKILLICAITTALLSQSASEFNNQQMQSFNEQNKEFGVYKKSQQEEFASYQESQMKAFEEYKKEVDALWEDPKMSTKKTWVAYTPDKKTRTDVDFEKEVITVETIASSPEEAKRKLKIALAKVVTIDTKTVQETDPLEKELAKIPKPAALVDSKVKAEPILANVVFNTPPTKQNVVTYVNKNISDATIKESPSNKVEHAIVYSVSVQMPKDAMLKRSKTYHDDIQKNARKQNLPMPLVFAIMHSESNFNPRAKSHIPAYGLMQIVPKSAGIDSYNYLYKEKKLVTGSYLYNSTNNITMGTAYLHILYYSYLKAIKNPDSRLYCTIAAYNTGSGNIAWAFNKNKNLSYKQKLSMSNAADNINALTPEQVYDKLLRDLKYDEPKNYLKKVSKRMSAYHKVYGS